jgi:hypothetical protein
MYLQGKEREEMNMKKVDDVVTSGLTLEERVILAQADILLHRLQMKLGQFKGTQALEDGDIVVGAELSRVRGVLSHYADHEYFKLIDVR